MLVTKKLTVAIDFYSIFFFVNGYRQLFCTISYFVFNRRKKLVQVWRWGNDDGIYFFVNYALK